MIVATVYASKPGALAGESGDHRVYNPSRVESLRQQFRRHLKVPHTFVCLTDDPALSETMTTIPLMHSWGGWWSKLELFAHDWQEPVLYCDLDNVLLGDVTALRYEFPARPFLAAHDWDYPVLNSSLMAWWGDYRYIYDSFHADPVGCAARNQAMPYFGDQGHIAHQLSLHGVRPLFWQHCLPDGFFASRWDVSSDRLSRARMVLWHGHPKPWQIENRVLADAMALDSE